LSVMNLDPYRHDEIQPVVMIEIGRGHRRDIRSGNDRLL
jgi:hypothetical protein